MIGFIVGLTIFIIGLGVGVLIGMLICLLERTQAEVKSLRSKERCDKKSNRGDMTWEDDFN